MADRNALQEVCTCGASFRYETSDPENIAVSNYRAWKQQHEECLSLQQQHKRALIKRDQAA